MGCVEYVGCELTQGRSFCLYAAVRGRQQETVPAQKAPGSLDPPSAKGYRPWTPKNVGGYCTIVLYASAVIEMRWFGSS